MCPEVGESVIGMMVPGAVVSMLLSVLLVGSDDPPVREVAGKFELFCVLIMVEDLSVGVGSLCRSQ